MVKIMKLFFFMVLVNVYIHFRMWIQVQNPRVAGLDLEPTIVTDPDPQHCFQEPLIL
jgi:hypothetical protein